MSMVSLELSCPKAGDGYLKGEIDGYVVTVWSVTHREWVEGSGIVSTEVPKVRLVKRADGPNLQPVATVNGIEVGEIDVEYYWHGDNGRKPTEFREGWVWDRCSINRLNRCPVTDAAQRKILAEVTALIPPMDAVTFNRLRVAEAERKLMVRQRELRRVEEELQQAQEWYDAALSELAAAQGVEY